jgi:hypothetical protein
MAIGPIELISSQSAAGDVTSAAYSLGDLTTFSIEVDFSGTDLAGTLTLQARNSDGYTWKTVAGSSQAVTSAADHIWSVSAAGYKEVRVFWDYTSGTGNIKAAIYIKQNPVINV